MDASSATFDGRKLHRFSEKVNFTGSLAHGSLEVGYLDFGNGWKQTPIESSRGGLPTTSGEWRASMRQIKKPCRPKQLVGKRRMDLPEQQAAVARIAIAV